MVNWREKIVFKGDKVLWYVIIMLMLASVMVVYSSTGRLAYSERGGNTMFYLIKQLFLIGGCFAVLFTMQSINYKYFSKYAGWVLFISFGLLLYAAVGGTNINGAGRWIRVPLIGLTFQPSELAKIGMMMFLARIIAFAQTDRYCEDDAFKKFLVYGGPVIIVIFMDNFSTSALVGFVCFILFMVGRLRWKLLGKIMLAVVGIAVVTILLLLYVPQVEKVGRLATVKSRIVDFASGSDESEGYSFQSVQAKIAVAKGGLMGCGPGNSTQRNFLPHSYSDFIYAIVIEEYGLIGGGFMMLLYLIILFRVGVIVRRCTRIYPALLVTGLGLTIVLQALIHMGVCVGAIPVTGQTLPLVSMGGTSLLFTSASFGMILSISHTFSEEGEAEEKLDEDGNTGNDIETDREDREEEDGVPEDYNEAKAEEKYGKKNSSKDNNNTYDDGWVEEQDDDGGNEELDLPDIEEELEKSGRQVLKDLQKRNKFSLH